MVPIIARTALVLLLTGSLVACPYSCMHHPREATGPFSGSGGCRCGGCQLPQPSEPGGQPGQLPSREGPCACPCICKGALAEFHGQITAADLEPAGLGPITAVAVEPPALLAETSADQPEPPPPRMPTGREIRALIASLLL